MTGILGLQSIPVLNKIFTSRQKQNDENEILISITPHILRAPKVVDEDLTGLLVGTEEIPRVEGARPSLFGPTLDPGSPPAAPGRSPGGPAASPARLPATGQTVPAPAPVPAPGTPPVPEEALRAEPGSSLPETAVLAPAVPALAEARPLTAQLQPQETAVAVGETVTVSLLVMGMREATGIEAVFTLGPGLELVETQPGSLLTFDGSPVGAERALEAGRVRVRFTRPTGATGSGAVVSLRLRGLVAGATTVALESLVLVTPIGALRPASAAASRILVN